MDQQEQLVAGAKPGDTLSYLELDVRAPAVGTRMVIFALPDALTGRIVTGHRVDDDGAWEVIRVESGRAASSMVRVRIRHR